MRLVVLVTWLIENKYAFAYNGGIKQKWSDF